MHKSLYAHAIEELQKAVDLSHSASSIIASLAEAYAASGNHHQAQKILQELEHVSKQRHVTAYPIARIYMALGQKEEAFRWLEIAYAEHAAMMFFLKTDPRFSELKSEFSQPFIIDANNGLQSFSW
jgi:predicted Zn-dependent protease